ncbi:helix-turn-helix domain-containing protein [Paenibacillus pasadenensis]|uniref:ArsR/SmtB family transcription factor n=1 Tax=Paenibacillus pasadenensis TaxID=217090 RepID=UPI00203B386A|nr:helix-turn-helix domain-containing protein [Paenibacillus pasadenensis]MCM3749190.1 helix-turn-helix domain-containing protein [Paenibacillus pasadenensis]
MLKTIEEIRIFSDPYRMKIMNQYYKASQPATIKEIADQLGEVPAKVYYHARKLESIGLLEVAETKIINGITARYYKAFEGTVEINREVVDDSIKQVFASEAQKLVARMFDESKQKYLNSQVSDSTRLGNVTNSNLFLTPDKVEELNEYLTRFINEHSKKTAADQLPYSLFYSLSNDAAESSAKPGE